METYTFVIKTLAPQLGKEVLEYLKTQCTITKPHAQFLRYGPPHRGQQPAVHFAIETEKINYRQVEPWAHNWTEKAALAEAIVEAYLAGKWIGH